MLNKYLLTQLNEFLEESDWLNCPFPIWELLCSRLSHILLSPLLTTLGLGFLSRPFARLGVWSFVQNHLYRRNSLKEGSGSCRYSGHACLICWGPHIILKVIPLIHWLNYYLQINVPIPSLGQFFPRRALVSHAKMCVLASPIGLPSGLGFFYYQW